MAGFWQGRAVLVTGAGGFIGSHLSERLAGEGAKVRAMVRYSSRGTAGWLEESPARADFEFVYGDIRDEAFVRESVRGMDTVFHLASLIAIPYSYRAPASYVETNVGGGLNVLQAAKEHGVRRVLHTSTSEVYGTALQVPIREDHPLQGQSPYSATKIGADKLAESYYLSYGTPVTTVRPFNTFGPRQSARAIIPTIICQLLAGPVVKLGNLAPTRDMNYVCNTVDGFLAAGSSDAGVGEVTHFGSGREISVGDLARLCAELMGQEIELSTESERTRPSGSEVERLLACNDRALSLFGWSPRVTLEEGLRSTIDWIRAHPSEYRADRYTV